VAVTEVAMSFIQKYFLRLYAIELEKMSRRRAPAVGDLGPYGEARMRTVLLLVMVMSGLGCAALVVGFIASEATRVFLLANRSPVLLALGVTSVVAAAVLVNRSVGKFEHSPESASAFGSERDRWIRSLQFYGVLVCSLAVPLVILVLFR
jgi:hypothetical protein